MHGANFPFFETNMNATAPPRGFRGYETSSCIFAATSGKVENAAPMLGQHTGGDSDRDAWLFRRITSQLWRPSQILRVFFSLSWARVEVRNFKIDAFDTVFQDNLSQAGRD